MSRKIITLLIALMTLAVLGLVGLQFYWIKGALFVQEEYFNQNVNRAMNEVVGKLERIESADMLLKRFRHAGSGKGKAHRKIQFFNNGSNVNGSIEISSDTDSIGEETNTSKSFSFEKNGEELDESEIRQLFDSVNSNLPKTKMFQDIFMDITIGNSNPLQNLEPKFLDSLIHAELKFQGIETPFVFGILNNFTGSFMYQNSEKDLDNLFQSPYKIQLFSRGLFPKPEILTLYFPSKTNFLYKKMALVLCSCFLLLIIIVLCFSYTFHTLLRQKKLNEMKTDFINNMTHEFKTPVSTILLASDALKDPDVLLDHERVHKLVDVIHSENNRIGGHVERVLQIAALDKGNVKLNYKEFELNELIEHIVDTFQLQVDTKGGEIKCAFQMKNALIKADELHIANVIYNLLDNAIKYSDKKPEILIETSDIYDKWLLISVTDNGIGMTKEQKNKIFEQFYRVPTGNIHNVKGFGLGLHYVKRIVQMHGGEIYVESEKNKGSKFTIHLPINV